MDELMSVEVSDDTKKIVQNSEDSNTKDKSTKSEEADPYAYLDRDDFTSEKFKIEIKGLPKFYGIRQFRKLLNEKLQLGSSKVKPLKQGSSWAYICFRSEEERSQALKVLNGYKWKGNTLRAHIAKPLPDPLVKKRKDEESKNNSEDKNKKLCMDPNIPIEQRVKDVACSYWNIPYKEQLERKERSIREVLLKLGTEIEKQNSHLCQWLKEQRNKYNGLPCELLPIKPSPVQSGYRNKCEFTIGLNDETGERTVGFRIGSYVTGSTSVAPIESVDIVPERMKTAAKVLESLVRSSEWDVFNPETHVGVWRQLTARVTQSGELMLVVGVHPQNLSEEELTKLKTQLRTHFETGEGQICKVTALFLEFIQKRAPGVQPQPAEHLLGETSIYETLCGLKMRISPQAFFQVNTLATEVLYNTIAELSGVSKNTTLLDVCCGTGSIGLCLSKQSGQVMGVEISKEAVDDAKANAITNNIENCEFFAGCAEELLLAMIKRSVKEDIVAVVDPPRAGLHQRAMSLLRNTKTLKKLVYVSCEPKAALKNFILLTRQVSKTYFEQPMVPVCAVPIDLFPQTPRCELIIYFERFDPNKEKMT